MSNEIYFREVNAVIRGKIAIIVKKLDKCSHQEKPFLLGKLAAYNDVADELGYLEAMCK